MTNKNLAIEIGESIIEILCDKRGFDGFWDDVDGDIQDEIIEEIGLSAMEIVQNNLAGQSFGDYDE